MMHILRAADPHNTTFIEGLGSDADTLGTNRIFVYDSTLFDFHQAELCLQFRNSQAGPKYSKHYHEIKDILLSAGKLHKTGCPPQKLSDACDVVLHSYKYVKRCHQHKYKIYISDVLCIFIYKFS